jgi:hypothetical protein
MKTTFETRKTGQEKTDEITRKVALAFIFIAVFILFIKILFL